MGGCGHFLALPREKPQQAVNYRALVDLNFLIQLTPFVAELLRLLLHAFHHRFLITVQAVLIGIVTHFLADLHGAELRPAHGAEVRHLGGILRQGFIVVFTGGIRV